MIRKTLLAAGLALAGVSALPAPGSAEALSRAQFDAALATAKAYGADRTLVLYCLRKDPEVTLMVWASVYTDLDSALDRLLSTDGFTPRMQAEVIQAVLANVHAPQPGATDAALEPQCADKDVARNATDARGVGRSLPERPPFDRLAP